MPILTLRGGYDKCPQGLNLEASLSFQNQIIYYKAGNKLHDQNIKKHTEEIFHGCH